MRHSHLALALLTAAALAACGGNESTGGDQSLKNKFSGQVSFGDSLSDVGTYNVGAIKAAGGGRFTINGDNVAINPTLTGLGWTELIARQIGAPAPCPAVTGLEGDIAGFSVPVVANAGCFSYAQGGSRVTNPVGPHHKSIEPHFGALTYPVTRQITNHLAVSGGKFKGDELVLVMAGGNDVLGLLDTLTADATAAGAAAGAAAGNTAFVTSLTMQLAAGATNPATAAPQIGLAMQTEAARPGSTSSTLIGAGVTAAAQLGNVAAINPAVHLPMVAKAQADALVAGNAAGAKAGAEFAAANGPKQVAAMAVAGTELAALTKTQVVGKGANYVVVANLPDVSLTPSSLSQSASNQALVKAMVNAFNDALRTGVAGEAKILYVDVYAVGQDQVKNPGPYGLTNVTTAACGANAVTGTSALTCTGKTLIAGDISHYLYADGVHPTPFGHMLLARYVSAQMIIKGWL
ncbi:esterase [Massilia eurypsychrophila]|uniref:Esterase n=1 Tax=Massilia eurypsychrophila TaxID=1485217 RepID=A0A2G8TJV1_9BURK|nr:SGNH/GDSL hydrolase family protein [Massilia eurypsychrophila]PIL46316.1 esterase [Massilia eurypsychrophila]